MAEYSGITLWRGSEDIMKYIKNVYPQTIFHSFTLSNEEKHVVASKLYHPHNISMTDSRVNNSRPLVCAIIKLDNPDIKIITRKEWIDFPLNIEMIKFKEELREKWSWKLIHTTDNLNEFNTLCETFGITDYPNNQCYVHIDKLKGIIWLDLKKSHMIRPIEETYHYQYLLNNKSHYINYVTNIDTHHTTQEFDNLIDVFNKKYIDDNISNIIIRGWYSPEENTYHIYDGLHRASIYKYIGIKYIKLEIETKPTKRDKNREYLHEHHYAFTWFTKILDKNNLRYMIIRGFKKLPMTPDTDLDIVCHHDDMNQVLKYADEFFDPLKKKIVKKDMNGVEAAYYPYLTRGVANKNINNEYFRIDLHNNFFFFYRIPILLNNDYVEHAFANCRKHHIYCIPSIEDELLLILLRVTYDLKSLRDKHKNMIIDLGSRVNSQAFQKSISFMNDSDQEYMFKRMKRLKIDELLPF